MKLKTLKDLIRYCGHDQARKLKTGFKGQGNRIRVINYNELKEEAVKWVKFEFEACEKAECSCQCCCCQSIRLAFKEFFNLTEEDLK